MRGMRALRWGLLVLGALLALVLLATGHLIGGGILAVLVVMRLVLWRQRRIHLARFEAAATAGMASIVVDGTTRRYLLHQPRRSSGPPMPLVVVLHGAFGTAPYAQMSYSWDALADAHGFAVLYPDGIGRSWNAGTCCGAAARDGVDDVTFIDALVTQIEQTLPIDRDRIYATGMSNGGMMAYRLACELPGRFAAIGPVAATMTVDCSRALPTSVCHVHGLEDDVVRFHGGIAARGIAHDVRPPVPGTIAKWRTIDDCGGVTARDDGSVHTETASGPSGATVTLVTLADAGHQWPGSHELRPGFARMMRLDPPSTALDTTAMLWQFFAVHPRPQTPSTSGEGAA